MKIDKYVCEYCGKETESRANTPNWIFSEGSDYGMGFRLCINSDATNKHGGVTFRVSLSRHAMQDFCCLDHFVRFLEEKVQATREKVIAAKKKTSCKPPKKSLREALREGWEKCHRG
jgi:hypothetical protein